jgi:competence protein ComFC
MNPPQFMGIKSGLVDLLFPKICQHCGDCFNDGISNILCRSCFESMESYEDPVCEHCGFSLPPRAFEDAVLLRCGDCGPGAYFLDRVRAFGPYGGGLRIAHHGFKFEGMESLKFEMARKMAQSVIPSFWNGVEALVPVPLSPERERERGYNPAELLAGEISALTGIPTQRTIRKIKSTLPQMTLPREERLQNPKGAYQVLASIEPMKKVILIDDVFTTGSTLEECARVLKNAGTAWVGALVFGRTPRHYIHS